MAIKDLNTLKEWFSSGKKPTQDRMWDWLDSFWHKNDSLPQDTILNLPETLDEKAEKSDFDAHVSDLNAHNLNSRLDGKANTLHTHEIPDVIGLGDTISALQATKADIDYVNQALTYQLVKEVKLNPAPLTGTTTNTIVLSVPFAANTLEDCSYLVVIIGSKNANSASSVNYRMYFGTSETIAGSTQIAFTQGEILEVQTYFSREIYIEGNNLRTVNFSAYAKNAMYNGNASSSYQTLPINKAVVNYLNFAIRLDNASDSAYYDRLRIIKIKNKP